MNLAGWSMASWIWVNVGGKTETQKGREIKLSSSNMVQGVPINMGIQ